METKEKIIEKMCYLKAESNNTIDLNAYAIGLSEMYDEINPKQNIELTDEHMAYFSDDMYLPSQYNGMKVSQPYYSGDGNLSVHELQKLCNQYKEYVHQQQIIKQNCIKQILELKFGVEFPNDSIF